MKFFKKIKAPSGEQIELLAYESWSVKWVSLSGNIEYPCSFNKKYNAEVFTSNEDANKFATSLRKAFAFLGMSGDITDVIVERNNK